MAYRITDEFLAEVRRIIKKVDNIRFHGITGSNTHSTITIGPVHQNDDYQPKPGSDPWFSVVAASPRWGVYTANPAQLNTINFDPTSNSVFQPADLFKVRTDITVYLVNMYEANKASSETSKNDLQAGQMFQGSYAGQCKPANDGTTKAIYIINGLVPSDCG